MNYRFLSHFYTSWKIVCLPILSMNEEVVLLIDWRLEWRSYNTRLIVAAYNLGSAPPWSFQKRFPSIPLAYEIFRSSKFPPRRWLWCRMWPYGDMSWLTIRANHHFQLFKPRGLLEILSSVVLLCPSSSSSRSLSWRCLSIAIPKNNPSHWRNLHWSDYPCRHQSTRHGSNCLRLDRNCNSSALFKQ